MCVQVLNLFVEGGGEGYTVCCLEQHSMVYCFDAFTQKNVCWMGLWRLYLRFLSEWKTKVENGADLFVASMLGRVLQLFGFCLLFVN